MSRPLIRFQAYLSTIARRDDRERGATMVEYGMLLAFIAMIAIVGVKSLGTTVEAAFTRFAGAI
ncbi:Flp family type IVb pilin [Flexivirga lutea]